MNGMGSGWCVAVGFAGGAGHHDAPAPQAAIRHDRELTSAGHLGDEAGHTGSGA